MLGNKLFESVLLRLSKEFRVVEVSVSICDGLLCALLKLCWTRRRRQIDIRLESTLVCSVVLCPLKENSVV